MEEKIKIVLGKIVKVKYARFLYQIDQLFFVIYVKNNLIILLTIFDYQAIQSARMANTKSAIKSIKKISSKTIINRSRKSRFRKAIKKMNLILEDKNKKEALNYLPKLNSELMKIAKTGIIKKENAARNISRITKKINSL